MDRTGSDGTSGTASTSREGKIKIGLIDAYSLLSAKYGWTTDFIKGKWRKLCPHTQESCHWGSCLERKTCKEFELELYGLTRPLFLKFVEICSEDNYQREKRLYNVLGVLITGKPVIKESNYNKNSINVEAKKKDILYDFPYDVEYPTEKMIADNVKYWEDYKGEPTLEYWGRERADAARGNLGIIARRCSVNTLLWREYKEGGFPDQKSLKNRLKLDHIRVALYPLDFPRHKICVDAPPLKYWQILKEEGKLKEYIEVLNSCGFTDIEGVVPVSEEHKEIIASLEEKKEEGKGE